MRAEILAAGYLAQNDAKRITTLVAGDVTSS